MLGVEGLLVASFSQTDCSDLTYSENQVQKATYIKPNGLLSDVVLHASAVRSLKSAECIHGLSWLHVSKPHPGTLGWKSMCSAAASCPVLPNLAILCCSSDFGISQIEN